MPLPTAGLEQGTSVQGNVNEDKQEPMSLAQQRVLEEQRRHAFHLRRTEGNMTFPVPYETRALTGAFGRKNQYPRWATDDMHVLLYCMHALLPWSQLTPGEFVTKTAQSGDIFCRKHSAKVLAIVEKEGGIVPRLHTFHAHVAKRVLADYFFKNMRNWEWPGMTITEEESFLIAGQVVEAFGELDRPALTEIIAAALLPERVKTFT
jgi:hypothetical protein